MRTPGWILGLILLAVVTGCASSSGGQGATATSTASPTSTAVFGEHNAADTQFAVDLIKLNRQGVNIANLVLTKAENPAIEQAAEDYIKKIQEQNLLVTQWLKAWAPPSDPPAPTGLLTEAQMTDLIVSTGPEFGQQLAVAIPIQVAGLREIAQKELDSGINPTARELAQNLLNNAESDAAALQG